jgi:CubicO group peptidase (beta-lactamase class C family)
MSGEGQLRTHTSDPQYRWSCFFIIGLILAGPASALSSESESLSASVDSYLRPYVESHNFSGTVLIAHGDSILIHKGFGMADYENSVPNTAETRFMIASVSKTFTAAAVLRLQERDQLSVDDTVDRFIPDFPSGNEITIHQLLSHTSGLPRFVFFPDYGERSKVSHSTKDLVDWISDKPLAFKPGERYGYSNTNYAFLAHIIEQASGLSYGDFLQANILGPLGLQATGHHADPASTVENLSKGHAPEGLVDIGPARFYDYSIVTGAGSLYSTTKDLLTWFRAQQRDSTSMEYGWNPDRHLDKDVVYKTGWDGVGFGAQFVHYVEDDLTIIVLTNFNVSSITSEITDNLAAIFFDKAYEPLRLSEKPDVEPSVLSDMAGLYRFGSDFYVPDATIRITEHDGQLLIPGDSHSPTGGLLPVSGLEFIHRQQWFKVTFEQDADKKIVGMQYGRFKAKKDLSD